MLMQESEGSTKTQVLKEIEHNSHLCHSVKKLHPLYDSLSMISEQHPQLLNPPRRVSQRSTEMTAIWLYNTSSHDSIR